MNRRFFITLFVVAAMLLSACGNEATTIPAASSDTEISAESNDAVSSLPEKAETSSESSAETERREASDNSGEEILYTDSRKILYHFIPESGLYDVGKLLELDDDANYNDVFNAVTDKVFPGKEIPTVNSMAMNKAYIVCDLGEDWLDTFNKGQLYEFCNTLVMTLQKNGYCESVGFRIDGEIGLLGGEVWDLAELKVLNSVDAEQFAAIRANIPYSGLKLHGGEHYFDFAKELKNDSKAVEIHRILKLAGELTNEFGHPSDNDMEYAIQHLIWATEPVKLDPANENYDVLTAQAVMPIAASVSQRLAMLENYFWFKEHIEETARIIYGDDVEIKHRQPLLPYKWFEAEGVYTPPHMGIDWNLIPHLYSYTEIGGVITAEVAYLRSTTQGFYNAAADKQMDNYDDVDQYLMNDAVRHEVTLLRASDGRLTLRGHRLIYTGGN